MVRGVRVNAKNSVQLAGITSGKHRTIGTINIELGINNDNLTHTFHLVQDDFGIHHIGILGRNFLGGKEGKY